jgi:hypothetical protein
MNKSTWTGAVSSDWNDADNWSPAGVPDASSDVTIATGHAVASASIGTVNSITDSSDLSLESAGTNTVATFLDDAGHLWVDHGAGEGGTILNIGETLTNSGQLYLGNSILSAPDTVTAAALDNTGSIYLTGSSANQALLDVTGGAGFGAAGVLSGHVRLAGDSAIEFASGEITSLAANAQLHLNGNDAFIEDSKALGSNSALTGLASIGAGAVLGLHNGAAVSPTGSLVNDGTVRLDIADGDGGSSLTVAGTLTNSGSLVVGNETLSAPDEVTAAALDNTDSVGQLGSIQLIGSSTNQALLDVTGSAGFGTAGVLTGGATLAGDSAIEFASGQITTINGYLSLSGNDAFIEDSTTLGSNSALAGLASISAGASLSLHDGAAVSTTGALVNDGFVRLDTGRGDGGSSLNIGGTLTDSGGLSIGNSFLSSPNSVTAETLVTSDARIDVTGGASAQALLDITAGVAGFGSAGTLTGSVSLNGDSAIEFASGQIAAIAAGSALGISGNDAFVEDSTALGSNSALNGLTDVAGDLYLDDSASVSTTGALVNHGDVILDEVLSSTGSTLSIGGTLTNTGKLQIGYFNISSSDSVTAKSFVNSETVYLFGNGENLAALNVSGATTNNGSISITNDTETLAGAVGGAGSFSLSSANLQFDSSVSARQKIDEFGADGLTLEQAQSFAATISGFGSNTGDTIDAANFLLSGTTYNFASGMLTLHDQTDGLTANIHLTGGNYTNSNFTLAPDSGTGTLVKFV